MHMGECCFEAGATGGDQFSSNRCPSSARQDLLVLTHAPRDEVTLAGDPGRIGRGEKNGSRCNVLRLADATKRSLGFNLFAHVALWNSGGVQSFGFDHAWIDRINANILW